MTAAPIHADRTCAGCFAMDPVAGCLNGLSTTMPCSEHRTPHEAAIGVHRPTDAPQHTSEAPGALFVGLVRPDAMPASNDGRPAHDPASSALKASPMRTAEDRHLMRSAIGPRLQTARELGGFSQVELAEALGYANTTQTSLWEKGARDAPLHMLVRASTVLGVSMDYLVGLTDEPDRDPSAVRRRAYLDSVRTQVNRLAEEVVGTFEVADRLAGPDADHFRQLVRSADALCCALDAFHRSNVDHFERLRGVAAVTTATADARRAAMKGAAALRVHDESLLALMRRLSALGGTDEG